MKMRDFTCTTLALVALLFAGCATGPRVDLRDLPPTVPFQTVDNLERPSPAMPQPPTEPFRLGVGDLVEIEVLEVGGTRRVCKVMPDGVIYYDLLPGYRAEGQTLNELRENLAVELAQHYRSPQVGVILRGVNSKRVWVLGRVNTPGLYPLDQPTTVLEALARSGGLFTSRFSGMTCPR